MIYLIDENLTDEKLTDKELTEEKLFPQLTLKELNDENSKHLKALRPDEGERVAFLNLKGGASVYLVKQAKPLVLAFEKNVRS